MNHTDELLAKAKEYCSLTGRARSGVSLEILNDSKFFDRIEAGAGCTVRTYEKVMKWFRNNWPENTIKPNRPHTGSIPQVNSAP
jgi:hypothetical protein